jgi:hypothetical protein
MAIIGRFVLLVLVGFVLMLGAHLVAIIGFGFGASIGLSSDLWVPYWWPYLILFPLATIVAVRRGTVSGLMAAFALCFIPALYFLVLGIAESKWSASSTAIVGVGLAFVLAAAMGRREQRRLRRRSAGAA